MPSKVLRYTLCKVLVSRDRAITVCKWFPPKTTQYTESVLNKNNTESASPRFNMLHFRVSKTGYFNRLLYNINGFSVFGSRSNKCTVVTCTKAICSHTSSKSHNNFIHLLNVRWLRVIKLSRQRRRACRQRGELLDFT